jgi:hypothetical protein
MTVVGFVAKAFVPAKPRALKKMGEAPELGSGGTRGRFFSG